MIRKLNINNQKTAQKGLPRAHRQPSDEWSEPLELGENMQVQARAGYRAAVVTLEPGLYLVSEVNQSAINDQPQEIGVAFLPLLGAGMLTAATQALRNPEKKVDLGKLPINIARWFRRRRTESEDADDTGDKS